MNSREKAVLVILVVILFILAGIRYGLDRSRAVELSVLYGESQRVVSPQHEEDQ